MAEPVLGPGKSIKTVLGGGSVTYFETYKGGKLAQVWLDGDGSTDLDVFVYDLKGKLIVQGTGPTDIETVTWIPAVNTTYRIVVRNLGFLSNTYKLETR
jgi:hypothetical protein